MNEIDVLINPEKYITVPPRLIGELDEQYKLRIMAFYDGYKSRQAEIDELQNQLDINKQAGQALLDNYHLLQKRVDEALRFYNEAKSPHNIGMIQMAIYLKGQNND